MELLLFIIIVIIVLKYVSKKTKEKLKVLVNTTKPEGVVLIDVIILKIIKDNKEDRTVFLPILKNNFTNKVYIPVENGNYGNILISYAGVIGKAPKITLRNLKKENIEFGTKGRLFIEQECGTITVDNNKVTIGNYGYIYEGNIFNTTGTIKSGIIYNMTDSNILSELNNAILYKGIADFDTEEVFREYFK
jgi:hypothetical protein